MDPRAAAYGTETATIATVQTLGLAAGYLFLSLNNAVLGGTETLLFGTFLGVSRGQVLTLLIVAVAALLLIAVAARPLLLETIDPEAAQARGLPIAVLDTAFLLVLAARGRRHQPDHRRPARVRAARGPGRRGPGADHAPWPRPPPQRRCSRWRSRGSGSGIAYFSIYPVGFYVTSLAFAVYLIARLTRAYRR